ncbi:MAG: glycosyltransferase [Patescibacteria group bacterium]|jgi:glycosyltransferase involved in cell wall biosynthesis
MTRIAIIHDFLTKIGGAEKVLMAFHERYPDAPVYTLLYDKEGTRQLFEAKDWQIHASSLNKYPSFLRKRPKLFLPFLSSAIEQFDLSEYDIVISFSNSYAHGVITRPTTLHITYCYSPMRYVWDWYHQYLEENKISYSLRGLLIRSILKDLRIWDRVAANRTDVWIAQSKTAQKRLKKYYRVDSTVIYPPANVEDIAFSDDLPDDYCLIVSRLEPYKKIDLAIEAFNKLKRPLVIIGEGSDKDRLKAMAGSNIEFLGWQSDQSIAEYLRNCYALIFPGEEDFGLTPVEAMAAGRPVVAYGRGGVTESLVENKTGLFFDNPSADSLIEAIEKLSENYTKFVPRTCRNRAEEFSKKSFLGQIEEHINSSYTKYKKAYEQD